MMEHIFGYVASGLNLLSMSMASMFHLRAFSALANGLFVIYGILLDAPPLMICCFIACMIHTYHMIKLKITSSEATSANAK